MPNWKKIRKLSLDELYVRASQKWSAFGERHSILSLGRLPDDKKLLSLFLDDGRGFSSVGELLDHFRSRPLKFFAAFENQEETTEILQRRFASASQLVNKAYEIRKGRFDLLGFKGLEFGS